MNKKFKTYTFFRGTERYEISEDLVGWYLLFFKNKNSKESIADYLLDTLEEALLEAENRFAIPQNAWQEI